MKGRMTDGCLFRFLQHLKPLRQAAEKSRQKRPAASAGLVGQRKTARGRHIQPLLLFSCWFKVLMVELHLCCISSPTSFWKHETSRCSQSACYWSQSLNLADFSNNMMDGAKVLRCLLTLTLCIYLGFHQFPLWISERFIIRREAGLT